MFSKKETQNFHAVQTKPFTCSKCKPIAGKICSHNVRIFLVPPLPRGCPDPAMHADVLSRVTDPDPTLGKIFGSDRQGKPDPTFKKPESLCIYELLFLYSCMHSFGMFRSYPLSTLIVDNYWKKSSNVKGSGCSNRVRNPGTGGDEASTLMVRPRRAPGKVNIYRGNRR